MSTNLNYKQVKNVTRRTWDEETYEKRTQDRQTKEEAGNTSSRTASAAGEEEEFKHASKDAARAHKSDRAFLKARTNKVNSLDSKIGSVEIINPEATATIRSSAGGPIDKDNAVTKSGIGWHCKVCDCFLKDSHTYLDHINGRKHQRNLGYSMRVERSTKEQVSSKLAALVKQKEQAEKATGFDDVEEEEGESYHNIVRAKDEELKRKKEERKKERKERRKKKKEQQKAETAGLAEPTDNETVGDNTGGNEEDIEEEEDRIDPNLAAMMGFSGFGGSKKKG